MIFPTLGSNPGLPHCEWILYQLSHKGSPSHEGSPKILEWVAYPFFSRASWPRNWTGVSCTAGGFFTNWPIREVLLSPNWNLFPSIILTQSNKCLNGHHVYQVSLVHSLQKKKKQKKYSRHCIHATVPFNTLQWFIIVLRIKTCLQGFISHLFLLLWLLQVHQSITLAFPWEIQILSPGFLYSVSTFLQ